MASEVAKAKDSQAPDRNPRGIPRAPFITDVEKEIGGPDVDINPILQTYQNALAKYRYMESNLTQRKRALDDKIPDIKKTLAMVEFLKERREGKQKASEDDDDLDDDLDGEDESSSKPLKTTFELNDTLYAEAELEESDTVYLWLGANVMLSYSIPDAIELLRTKLDIATTNLGTVLSDLEFLKEQVTIMEVNTARVYNWDVKRRRERKEAEAAAAKKA